MSIIIPADSIAKGITLGEIELSINVSDNKNSLIPMIPVMDMAVFDTEKKDIS